jgi:hypothetical protein
MQLAYRRAKENNRDSQQISKEYYDLKSKEMSFSVGDRVLVFFNKSVAPGKGRYNPKLLAEWRDGYSIIERTGPLSYLVRRSPHSKPHPCHVNRLKLDPSLFTNMGTDSKRFGRRIRQRQRLLQAVPEQSTADSDDDEDDDGWADLAIPPPLLQVAGPAAHAPAAAPAVPALIEPAVPAPPVIGPPAPILPPQQVGLGIGLDRLAEDIFRPFLRHTRAAGPVADLPNVQPRILERQQRPE